MPLFGNDFLEAVNGYGDGVGMGYLRAIWHYWHQTHCEGIPNDEGYRRRICRCDSSDWPAVGPVVFGQLFKLKDGLWHQDRCRSEYSRTVNSYNNKVSGAAQARRAKIDINPDTKPDIRADKTPDIQHNQNQNQNQNHSQNENHSISVASATPRSAFQKPTIEVIKLQCAKIGLPESEAQHFWNHYEANGWKVGRNPMKSWTAALSNWKLNFEKGTYARTQKHGNAGKQNTEPDWSKGF